MAGWLNDWCAEFAASHPGAVHSARWPEPGVTGYVRQALESGARVFKVRRVRLDTTMVGTPYLDRIAPVPADVLAAYRDLGERIVLGTDFPNIPYSYARQIQSLLEWGFGDDWLRQVLWHNGATLMGL